MSVGISAFVMVRNDRSEHGAHRMPPQTLAAEVAEFAAWHAMVIHPNLNGFQGYDTLRFSFV